VQKLSNVYGPEAGIKISDQWGKVVFEGTAQNGSEITFADQKGGIYRLTVKNISQETLSMSVELDKVLTPPGQ
jgi:hypothetical protein